MYRNVSDFTTRWFLQGSCHVTLVPPINGIVAVAIVVVIVVVVVIGVLALSDWGPLVKQEMRTVITVTTRTVGGGGHGGATMIVNLMRMIVVVVAVVVVVLSRRSYMDPLLLPLPNRPSEHSGRSVPSRGPSESGPNSFHHSLTH